MAEKLARFCKVLIFNDPPENSRHSLPEANPRYVENDFRCPMLDVGISWRMPHMGRQLKVRARKVYLWPHDTCAFRMTKEEINAFDDILWLSNWQRLQWTSLNLRLAKFTKVFGNGINPEDFKPLKQRSNPVSCIYGSNYGQGLDILLNIWPDIKKQFPKASLDIYYGFEHWGLLSPEKGAKIKTDLINLNPLDVKEHGQVGHDELNRAYEKASLWTYPCMGMETFCITALRAQYAGALPVIIEGSALNETVKHGFKCDHEDKYTQTLIEAMHYAEKMPLDEREKMREFILREYTWDILARKWMDLFFHE